MGTRLLCAALAVCAGPFALHATSLYDATILASSPLAYWTLGDSSGTTAADLTGNGRNGTYQGGFTLGASGPFAGASATTFNGSSGYVSLPGVWGGTAAGTIEAWINVAVDTGSFQAIVSPTDHSFFHYQVNTFGNDVVYVDDGGAVDLAIIPPAPLGDWRYLVITAENGAENWYENAVLVSSASTAFGHLTASVSGDVRIASGFGGERFFNGALADVAIYDRALSATEIQAHFNAASVPEPGALALCGGALIALGFVKRRR